MNEPVRPDRQGRDRHRISRGIGRAIAEEMAEQGAKVVISSRKQDACEEVAASDQRAQGGARRSPSPRSISDKDALREAGRRDQGRFGQIDILVCNAASNPYYGPMARDHRRPVPQDPGQQCPRPTTG